MVAETWFYYLYVILSYERQLYDAILPDISFICFVGPSQRLFPLALARMKLAKRVHLVIEQLVMEELNGYTT